MKRLIIIFLLLACSHIQAKTALTQLYEHQQAIDQFSAQLRHADIELLRNLVERELVNSSSKDNKFLIKIQYLIGKLQKDELLAQEQKISAYQTFISREKVRKNKKEAKK